VIDQGLQSIALADRLEVLADEMVADEGVLLTAATIIIARRAARLAGDHDHARHLAMTAGANIGVLLAVEFEKKLLGV
jgi:hypothetical protein